MTAYIGSIKLPLSRLHLELTNICNFNCEFCPDSKMKRARGLMSFQTATAILDEVSETGVARTVHFHLMGEPTLHPRLTDIVAYASDKGIATCLTTNGGRLNEHLLDALLYAGISRIIISLQTPDSKTFQFRGVRGQTFEEYSDRILRVVQRFLQNKTEAELEIHFLSSPLRRLIIPVFPEVSIADTSKDLKGHLRQWVTAIIRRTALEVDSHHVFNQIEKIHSFRENVIRLTERLTFNTRIMGDWAVHFDKINVEAQFGFCPALQDHMGILWDGRFTFCCTDFDGKTSCANFSEMSIVQFLGLESVQKCVDSFNRFSILHSYCKQCIGDRNILNTLVRQIGSICYFKFFRRKHY